MPYIKLKILIFKIQSGQEFLIVQFHKLCTLQQLRFAYLQNCIHLLSLTGSYRFTITIGGCSPCGYTLAIQQIYFIMFNMPLYCSILYFIVTLNQHMCEDIFIRIEYLKRQTIYIIYIYQIDSNDPLQFLQITLKKSYKKFTTNLIGAGCHSHFLQLIFVLFEVSNHDDSSNYK